MDAWHIFKAIFACVILVGFIVGTFLDDWADHRAGPLR